MSVSNSVARLTFVVLALACGLNLVAQSAIESDGNWTRFRGPNGSGYVADTNLPATWTADDYDWMVTLKGSGSSSPVVYGDQMYVTSADPDTAEVYLQCFDIRTGVIKWMTSVPSTPYRVHGQNSYASSTPAVDQRHVYLLVGSPEKVLMVAFNHDGVERWRRDFGPWVSQHGFSASLITYRDRVIFINSQQATGVPEGQTPGESVAYAIEADTGATLWETPLTTTRANYSAPCIYAREDKPDQILCSSMGEGVFSLVPETGAMIWSLPALQMRTVSATITDEDLVYASNGSGGGGNYLVAVRVPETDEHDKPLTDPEIVFELRDSANYVPSPIIIDDMLFTFSDRGIISCYDKTTGEQHWTQRVNEARAFSGSPVAASQHIYVMTPEGSIVVIKAAKEYELVHSIATGEETRSTPSIAAGRILFRTATRVFSLSTPSPDPTAPAGKDETSEDAEENAEENDKQNVRG